MLLCVLSPGSCSYLDPTENLGCSIHWYVKRCYWFVLAFLHVQLMQKPHKSQPLLFGCEFDSPLETL